MDPLELAILALRVALVLILYAFLAAVLRVAASSLKPAPAEFAEPTEARGTRNRTTAPRTSEKQTLRLIVLKPGDTTLESGGVIEAPSGAILGRGRRATIVLADSTVSTEHAHLGLAGDTWVVRDLGSTNGTLLNETPVNRDAPLSPGDVLGLGNVQLKVVATRS